MQMAALALFYGREGSLRGGGGDDAHPGKYQDFLTNSVQPAEINKFCCKITQNALQ